MHIVVFPGWYPNKVDQLSGDFIQRHMYAIAGFCKVSVVIPVKEVKPGSERLVTVNKGNLTEIYYYYPSFTSIKWLDRLFSFIRYNYHGISSIRALYKQEKIDLVHLYVLQKNFLIGLLVQAIYRIPYVITECSTFYVDGRFDSLSNLQKWCFRQVFDKSAAVHSVSLNLAQNLKAKLGLQKDPVIIANVVDSGLFYYNNDLTSDKVTFVHVSNMTTQKNVDGMLEAFALVKKINKNFLLHLVGPMPDRIKIKIDVLGLSRDIVIWNERSYTEVAEIMQQSDVFVLFTKFETFGCVIIEANACGLPVIVSDLEVTRELINEKFNGVFVQNENVQDLFKKILFMIDHQQEFDPLAISLQTRNKFNYERIGQQFNHWFNSVCATRMNKSVQVNADNSQLKKQNI